MNDLSPFQLTNARPLQSDKFSDLLVTAKGDARAFVEMTGMNTLWFNTGTLCNLACQNCYIESSPTNDALVYITEDEVRGFLDEIEREGLPTTEIGFTGGEPFMNNEMLPMLQLCLERGFSVLMLTNAMRPMRRFEQQLIELKHKDKITFRVSLDHYTQEIHEGERGANSWDKAIDGLKWLSKNGFKLAIAGRHLDDENDAVARAGYAALCAQHDLNVDVNDPMQLVLFPEMDANADIAEITTDCWNILDVDPAEMMCASSRMVVKRKGEDSPRVAACTLLPYEADFDMGATLQEASQKVMLNHPHCARFCVLGGASCSA